MNSRLSGWRSAGEATSWFGLFVACQDAGRHPAKAVRAAIAKVSQGSRRDSVSDQRTRAGEAVSRRLEGFAKVYHRRRSQRSTGQKIVKDSGGASV